MEERSPDVGPEVLVTWPDYALDGAGSALLSEGLRIRMEPKLGARSTADLTRLAAGAQGAIVSTDPFDADVLAALPDLRVIARVGVGIDSIDVSAATANGVAVTITPGVNETVVAEHTLALMLALVRRLREQDHGVRAFEWRRTGAALPWSLRGATVGLVGFGRIGRLVATRLEPFGVRLLATDPALEGGEQGVTAVSLPVLLAESDVVSLHCPLLPATTGLIGTEELQMLGPEGLLINTSRGGIVQEAPLIEALAAGRIRGAGLDVFEVEPPTDPRLLDMPNVLLSPHNAALSDASVTQMTQMATDSVIDVLAGRLPQHVVNPEVFEGVRGA